MACVILRFHLTVSASRLERSDDRFTVIDVISSGYYHLGSIQSVDCENDAHFYLFHKGLFCTLGEIVIFLWVTLPCLMTISLSVATGRDVNIAGNCFAVVQNFSKTCNR